MLFYRFFKKKLLYRSKQNRDFKFFNSLLKSFQKYIHRVSFFVQKNRTFLLCMLVAFMISDLLLIRSYHFVLADKKLPSLSLVSPLSSSRQSVEKYKTIWENNIFHTGSIPTQLEGNSVLAQPVLSSLPFKLKGTIIHANPKRSVATISAGADNKTLSYQSGDVIEKQAEIKEILRAKVIFFNQNNNRLEYVLIPEKEASLQMAYKQNEPEPSNESLVKKSEGNQFQVKRSDINDYLQRLPELLKQARVVPHYSKRTGEIEGFRFAAIDEESIFTDLGFEKGDIIKEVDGERVTTPEKALELFDRLKGGSGFKMLVQKDGRDVYYEYSVNENAPIR